MAKLAIIDDENEILTILEKFLNKSTEHTIVTFNNPLEGLAALNNEKYDLVLLDIMMPQMDGIDLLQELRASNNQVKVIMMTAFSTLKRTLDAHKFGAENYIEKPFQSLNFVKDKIETELKK